MTKTPTAEEVLGLYREYLELQEEWESAAPDDAVAELAPQIALVRFEEALRQHDDSQGPVTREWFVERFGATFYWPKKRVMLKCDEDGVWLVTKMINVTHCTRLYNPTRSDIETLVRVLGGEA